jgi:hypothetical protein
VLGFWLPTVEFAYDIVANRPRSDRRGLGLLAFDVRLPVGRADEAAFDEDMSAFLDGSENSLSQPRANHGERSHMPGRPAD